jgi:ABC-type sugar transport system substrate-binding protein
MMSAMPRTPHRSGGYRRRVASTLCTACVAVSIAACSSGTNSGNGTTAVSAPPAAGSTTSSASTSACVAAASEFLAPYDQLPTNLPVGYASLKEAPKPGTVIHIVGPLPSEQTVAGAEQQAAVAAGWTYKALQFDGSVADLNTKFMEAVSEKPTMITLLGWPVADLKGPLAAAKRAGIVVVFGDVTDPAESNPGLAAVTGGVPTYKLIGELNAYEFMRDSGCKGSVALFNLSAYPILKVGADAFMATVKAKCPACSVSYGEMQPTDIGTPAALQLIVSKLQSDPSIDYVGVTLGDMVIGLSAALKQAGITGVRIFGADPVAEGIAALKNGTNSWWVEESPQINGVALFDAGLRAIESGTTANPNNGNFPLYVLTQKNVPTGAGIPVAPPNYLKEFENLWDVG